MGAGPVEPEPTDEFLGSAKALDFFAHERGKQALLVGRFCSKVIITGLKKD